MTFKHTFSCSNRHIKTIPFGAGNSKSSYWCSCDMHRLVSVNTKAKRRTDKTKLKIKLLKDENEM